LRPWPYCWPHFAARHWRTTFRNRCRCHCRKRRVAQALTRLDRPILQIERALLISIDGCRPDLLLRAKTPNVRKLMESGSYTVWARTVPVAVTLPAHASMLTGVMPEKHGITWNGQLKDAEIARPKVPTLFEIAMRYGMSTAVVAGKSKFDSFAQIGHVGRAWTKSASDEQVAAEAVRMIHDYSPEILFVHFPGADKAGHATGWASPEQITALEGIDEQIGKVIAALGQAGLRDKTAVLVTSDHGGAGRGHGTTSAGAAPEDPRNQHIPWVLNGPGIRKGYDLSRDARLQIHTVDTFATLCYLLGLEPQGDIDGKPVKLAVEGQQEQLLIKDAK
jgi:arylsulfatase A-like enzyme